MTRRLTQLILLCLGLALPLAGASCALHGGDDQHGISAVSTPDAPEAAADETEFAQNHDYLSTLDSAAADSKETSSTKGLKPTILGAYISIGMDDVTIAERQMKDLSAAGCNTVIDYNLVCPDLTNSIAVRKWTSYMAAAKKYNIKVAFCLPRYLKGLTPRSGTSNAYFNEVKRVITQVRSEPQIGYWYVHDEKLPSTNIGTNGADYTISMDQMKALYALIKQTDSVAAGGKGRKTLNVWVNLPTYSQYKARFTAANRPYGDPAWLLTQAAYDSMIRTMVQQTCDIVMIDNYPVGNPGVPAGTPVDEYPNIALARGKSQLKPGQMMIFAFQSFSWKAHNPTGAPNAKYPTKAQMLQMLGAGSRNDVKGAIAYNFYDLDNPRPARDLPGRLQCLADLKAVLKQLSTTGMP